MKFTTQQNRNLSKFENHKIVYDGYDYWWHSRKEDKFTLHCIIPFNNYKTLLINIKCWLPKYLKDSIDSDCIDSMLKDLFIDVKIKDIANNIKIDTNNKIKLILELKPDIKPKELSLLLNVTKMTISRKLKPYKAK